MSESRIGGSSTDAEPAGRVSASLGPAPNPEGLTLGIDLGTSSVKVVALNAEHLMVGEGSASFATHCELPDQAEQQPGDWLQAASDAMHALSEQLQGMLGLDWRRHVAAVGLTGQLPTLVCLGDRGPLTPAITWKDGRADEWASRRVDASRRTAMYARTGMPIDGRYLAPMVQFHFADRINDVRCILSAKDYLLAELTGLRMTEPSTAAGYGIYDLQSQSFSAELAEFWGLPLSLLPPVCRANTMAGGLSQFGAKLLNLVPGIPVSSGAADSVCASFAMAGLDESTVSISFGSSAVVIGVSATPRLDPQARYLVTPHVSEHWYGREMDLLATGTGYEWLSNLFSWRDGNIDRYAAQSVPGAQGLWFPPYLAGGEQGALWNPRLQGALLGLNLRHSRADIARAFLEGGFFEIKRCIDALAETTPVDSVMVSGNIVHWPTSVQMLADILARPVGTLADRSPAAIGAALLARGLCDAEPSGGGSDDGSSYGGSGSLPRRRSREALTRPDPPTAQLYAALYPQYLVRSAQCAQ